MRRTCGRCGESEPAQANSADGEAWAALAPASFNGVKGAAAAVEDVSGRGRDAAPRSS
jgi:hypothetical protein